MVSALGVCTAPCGSSSCDVLCIGYQPQHIGTPALHHNLRCCLLLLLELLLLVVVLLTEPPHLRWMFTYLKMHQKLLGGSGGCTSRRRPHRGPRVATFGWTRWPTILLKQKQSPGNRQMAVGELIKVRTSLVYFKYLSPEKNYQKRSSDHQKNNIKLFGLAQW